MSAITTIADANSQMSMGQMLIADKLLMDMGIKLFTSTVTENLKNINKSILIFIYTNIL